MILLRGGTVDLTSVADDVEAAPTILEFRSFYSCRVSVSDDIFVIYRVVFHPATSSCTFLFGVYCSSIVSFVPADLITTDFGT